MKKYLHKNSKSLTICGVLLCTVLIVVLSFQFLSTIAYGQLKKQYSEPGVRPDIRADAVWDSDLGIWLLSHADSKNEIDLAIMYSVELALKEAPSIYSAISPRSSEAILTAMSTLSPSSYPEVWERICVEPAYRAQKIVALEQFLCVSFDELGLYDSSAQRKWFDSFNVLKQEVFTQSFEQITKAEIAQYGNLLLPVLMQKAQDNTLCESELGILDEMIIDIDRQFYQNIEPASLNSTRAASEWFDTHSSTIEAITKIIQSNYEWVE